jgi:hypothetical protein
MSFILFVPPPIQEALELVNISKRKMDVDIALFLGGLSLAF